VNAGDAMIPRTTSVTAILVGALVSVRFLLLMLGLPFRGAPELICSSLFGVRRI